MPCSRSVIRRVGRGRASMRGGGLPQQGGDQPCGDTVAVMGAVAAALRVRAHFYDAGTRHTHARENGISSEFAFFQLFSAFEFARFWLLCLIRPGARAPRATSHMRLDWHRQAGAGYAVRGTPYSVAPREDGRSRCWSSALESTSARGCLLLLAALAGTAVGAALSWWRLARVAAAPVQCAAALQRYSSPGLGTSPFPLALDTVTLSPNHAFGDAPVELRIAWVGSHSDTPIALTFVRQGAAGCSGAAAHKLPPYGSPRVWPNTTFTVALPGPAVYKLCVSSAFVRARDGEQRLGGEDGPPSISAHPLQPAPATQDAHFDAVPGLEFFVHSAPPPPPPHASPSPPPKPSPAWPPVPSSLPSPTPPSWTTPSPILTPPESLIPMSSPSEPPSPLPPLPASPPTELSGWDFWSDLGLGMGLFVVWGYVMMRAACIRCYAMLNSCIGMLSTACIALVGAALPKGNRQHFAARLVDEEEGDDDGDGYGAGDGGNGEGDSGAGRRDWLMAAANKSKPCNIAQHGTFRGTGRTLVAETAVAVVNSAAVVKATGPAAVELPTGASVGGPPLQLPPPLPTVAESEPADSAERSPSPRCTALHAVGTRLPTGGAKASVPPLWSSSVDLRHRKAALPAAVFRNASSAGAASLSQMSDTRTSARSTARSAASCSSSARASARSSTRSVDGTASGAASGVAGRMSSGSCCSLGAVALSERPGAPSHPPRKPRSNKTERRHRAHGEACSPHDADASPNCADRSAAQGVAANDARGSAAGSAPTPENGAGQQWPWLTHASTQTERRVVSAAMHSCADVTTQTDLDCDRLERLVKILASVVDSAWSPHPMLAQALMPAFDLLGATYTPNRGGGATSCHDPHHLPVGEFACSNSCGVGLMQHFASGPAPQLCDSLSNSSLPPIPRLNVCAAQALGAADAQTGRDGSCSGPRYSPVGDGFTSSSSTLRSPDPYLTSSIALPQDAMSATGSPLPRIPSPTSPALQVARSHAVHCGAALHGLPHLPMDRLYRHPCDTMADAHGGDTSPPVRDRAEHTADNSTSSIPFGSARNSGRAQLDSARRLERHQERSASLHSQPAPPIGRAGPIDA